ncbi:sodium:proton antiporter [Citricoccus alkalitolerans]|uniref:Cation:proton antiporter n=1 Tax=Citricoccus alkalitolerans TaxID=246603 RepID=A0ABV8XZD3_9MICC
MVINQALALFAGVLLVLSAFSRLIQRLSLPGPVLALAAGVVIGPFGLGWLRVEDFRVPVGTLLEQASRITLAIGLTGVALRLPHGYWRSNLRWVVVIIGLGMALMFAVATGILWALLGVPVLVAVLLGAIITPTDPVVTTPIVTGSLAEERITERVRHNLSAESGINDGAAYLFVLAPILLITAPGTAWHELLTTVLWWEVAAGAVFGALAGWLLGRLFVAVRHKQWMEESSYLGFLVPLGLVVLGAGKLLGFDAVLSVFVAAAVFGQTIPQRDEEQEDRVQDAISHLVMLPIFTLLGLALPFDAWAGLGWITLVAVTVAVLGRRLAALWALRPLLRRVHDVPETVFLSWFGPIGVSALFYATLAERHTGNHEIFVYVTLAITVSVVLHGISTVPLSAWLHRREPQHKQQHDSRSS